LLPANPPAIRTSAIAACVKTPIDRPPPSPMRPEDASRAAAATTVLRLFDGFPRAEVISDAATQAPSASFHMLRYDLFMRFELGFDGWGGVTLQALGWLAA